MTSYQYRNSHCRDKTILRPSYLHNGISYTDKYLYIDSGPWYQHISSYTYMTNFKHSFIITTCSVTNQLFTPKWHIYVTGIFVIIGLNHVTYWIPSHYLNQGPLFIDINNWYPAEMISKFVCYYSDVMRASQCLKSSATWLFIQQFV